MDISRRRFLSGVASVPVSLRLGSISGIITATTMSSRPAHAWVMAAIAVASVVAGMVADHNRGDGGLGAVLAATQQKLTLIIETLADLQKQVANVLEEIANLPVQVEAILRRDDIRKLQRECRAVLDEYLTLLKVRETFSSDRQWLDDKVRADLRSLLERLQAARGNMRADGAIDPTAALVVSSIAFLEHSLMNLLGYRPVDIRVRLQAAYLPWFNDIVDPKLSNSSQSYLENAAKRHAELMKMAAGSPVGKRLGMQVGKPALNVCVGVNDFTPRVPGELYCDDVGPRFTKINPSDSKTVDSAVAALSSKDDTPEYLEKLRDGLINLPRVLDGKAQSAVASSDSIVIALMRGCRRLPGTPEVPGEQDRLFQNVSLIEEELKINGTKTGIIALKLVANEPGRGRAGEPSVPADCAVEKLTIHDPNARRNRMIASPAWTNAQQQISAFNTVLDDILTERSKASFALSAVSIANTSRAQLVDLLKRYA